MTEAAPIDYYEAVETIKLPLVATEDTLQNAFQIMKSVERSGFVVIFDNRVWLHKAGEVVVGISRGQQFVRDLEKKWSVAIASDAQISLPNLDWLNPRHTWQAFESLLDNVKGSYLLMRLPATLAHGSMLRIITQHEGLRAEIASGPLQCYCTDTSTGPHECRRMPADRMCQICGMPIVCL